MSNVAEHFDDIVALPRQSTDAVEPMVVWVPGEQVSVYELEMPDVPKRRWADMLPWLLEDQLLRPAEDLHFVVGPEVGDNHILVYVVGKEQMNQWRLMAESKALSIQQAVPDYLALPMEEGYVSVTIVGQRMLVRTGVYTGFAAHPAIGWQLLDIERQKNEDLRVTALVEHTEGIPEEWREEVSAQSGRLNWSFAELPDVNLISGEYKPTKTANFAPWYPAIGLAVCTLILAVVYMMVQTHQWQQDIGVLEQGIADAYQGLLNESFEGSVKDIPNAVESRIRLLEYQNITLQESPVFELRALDQVLSVCRDCDVKKIVHGDDSLTVTLKVPDSIRTRLENTEGLALRWSAANSQGVVNMLVARSQ